MSGYVSSVHSITEKPNNETITEITNFDSEKVVGLYAQTKAEAAKYVIDAIKNKNLNACIIHPSGIIGPNDYGNSHLTQLVLPLWLAELVAPICELYYNIKKQTPLFTKYSLYTLSSNSNFSKEKAKRELNYKNRDMKDTIKDTIKWLQEKNYI